MSHWVAVSFGALDLTNHALAEEGYELVVCPIFPGSPHFLYGAGARLWRKFVADAIEPAALSPAEREIAEEMRGMGLLAESESHPARVTHVAEPWMKSYRHELVYALIQNVARENGIDVVFIKGPTLAAQALRERDHSGDVDCWVHPREALRLANALRPWGWSPALSAFTGTLVLHSLTLRGNDWSCAVDVHSWFPGLALEATDAYRRVRSRTEERCFASVRVRTPDRVAHAVLSALHDVRPLQGELPGPGKLSWAANTLRAAGPDVVGVVRELGAVYALRDPLRLAFPGLDVESDAPRPPDWAWRSQRSPLLAYREAFKLVGWRNAPRIIYRMIWPAPETLHATEGVTTALLRYRINRLASIIRQLGRRQ